jgi:hypothetical protein
MREYDPIVRTVKHFRKINLKYPDGVHAGSAFAEFQKADAHPSPGRKKEKQGA